MTTRPRVSKLCVADRYALTGERIVEFSFSNGKGGLIALREYDGRTTVDVYRVDDGVDVRCGDARGKQSPV